VGGAVVRGEQVSFLDFFSPLSLKARPVGLELDLVANADLKIRCGGPKLHSFAGKNESMSPKARINTWLGYAAPFDRHDWVVDRCGTRIEYVIDFYAGKPMAGGKAGPSFYLDVRPKLNSWEGVKMRALRAAGLV
jgi:cytochrome c heme-lyase